MRRNIYERYLKFTMEYTLNMVNFSVLCRWKYLAYPLRNVPYCDSNTVYMLVYG